MNIENTEKRPDPCITDFLCQCKPPELPLPRNKTLKGFLDYIATDEHSDEDERNNAKCLLWEFYYIMYHKPFDTNDPDSTNEVLLAWFHRYGFVKVDERDIRRLRIMRRDAKFFWRYTHQKY